MTDLETGRHEMADALRTTIGNLRAQLADTATKLDKANAELLKGHEQCEAEQRALHTAEEWESMQRQLAESEAVKEENDRLHKLVDDLRQADSVEVMAQENERLKDHLARANAAYTEAANALIEVRSDSKILKAQVKFRHKDYQRTLHDVMECAREAIAVVEAERDALGDLGTLEVAKSNKRHVEHMAQTLEEALQLLDELVDPDPCSFDHHGYCQAHGYFTEGECPDARAKRLLAAESTADVSMNAPLGHATADETKAPACPNVSYYGRPCILAPHSPQQSCKFIVGEDEMEYDLVNGSTLAEMLEALSAGGRIAVSAAMRWIEYRLFSDHAESVRTFGDHVVTRVKEHAYKTAQEEREVVFRYLEYNRYARKIGRGEQYRVYRLDEEADETSDDSLDPKGSTQ